MAVIPETAGGGTAAALMNSAQAHQSAGETAEAVVDFIAAGNAYLHDEADAPKARQAFNTAAALDPQNLDAIFALGKTDTIEGKLRDALGKFVLVIRKSNQAHVPALFEAGCIYQELGKFDQAVHAFRKVLDRDGSNVQAMVNVARRLQAMGMRPEALEQFIRAAETAHDAKHYGTCRQLLNLILSMDPLNAKVRSMLAELNDHATAENGAAARVELHADLGAVHEPHADEKPTPSAAHDAEAAAIAALRIERDRLQRDIEALGSAKATEEFELAKLHARRDGAVAELTELFRKIETLKSTPAGVEPATEAAQSPPARKAERPKTRRATKSKTRSGRTP